MSDEPRKQPAGTTPATRAVHGGERRARPQHALAEPIVQTVTYTFDDTADLETLLAGGTVRRMIESHGARVFHCAVTVAAGLRYAPTSAWLRFCGGQVRELTALYASLSTIYEAVNDGVGLAPPSLSVDHPKLPAAPVW